MSNASKDPVIEMMESIMEFRLGSYNNQMAKSEKDRTIESRLQEQITFIITLQQQVIKLLKRVAKLEEEAKK